MVNALQIFVGIGSLIIIGGIAYVLQMFFGITAAAVFTLGSVLIAVGTRILMQKMGYAPSGGSSSSNRRNRRSKGARRRD